LSDAPPGAVTAAYLYDAWGNYRELDLSNPAAPDKLADPDDPADPDPAGWFASPDLGPDGFSAWEYYLANIQSAFDPRLEFIDPSPEPPASSLAVWNRLTYTGHEFDPETGLYYFKARFYDPELGRFASADPYLGDTLTPPSLHRYLYAYASPLRYVDLTGYYSVSAVGDDHLVVAVDRLDAARESQVAGSSVTGLLQWFEFEESAERRQFLAQLGALNPWMVTERGWAGREFRAGRKVILPSGYAVSAAGKQHLTDYLIAQHEANRSYGAKVGAAVGERVSEGAVMGLAWLAVTLGADPAGWVDDAITIAGEFGKFLDERSLRQAAVTAGYTAAAVLPAASTRAVKAVEQAVDKALDAARRTAAEATQRLSSDALQQIAAAADDIIRKLEKAPDNEIINRGAVTYETDATGATLNARGRITGPHPRRIKGARPEPQGGRLPGEHRGHLIPEGGVDNPADVNVPQNIISEAPGSNLGPKKSFDLLASRTAQNYPSSVVETLHTPLRCPGEIRPYAVRHSIIVDGRIVHIVVIPNQ